MSEDIQKGAVHTLVWRDGALHLIDQRKLPLSFETVICNTAEETAAAVGSTAGAIRVAQHRAIARLKKEVTRAGERNG